MNIMIVKNGNYTENGLDKQFLSKISKKKKNPSRVVTTLTF